MKKLRSVRALAVLGVLTALAILVVIPAFASTPGQPVPPPSGLHNVTPTDYGTGGQPNDCSLFYSGNTGSQPPYQYRIANPKDQTYTTTVNGTKVTFTIDMNPSDATGAPAYANDKYFSFTSTGAAIVDVGVKGGTDSTRYTYAGLGSVSSDTVMHAPAQSVDASNNPTQLYSVSNITFCFAQLGSVSGTVYQDANQNGSNDTGDAGLGGWTVDLYKNGSVTATTSSASNGSYTFALVLDPTATYRVCEAPPSGTWAQSQPLPSTTNLCSTPELPKGYQFQPSSATQSISGDDFGNVGGATCPPNIMSSQDGSYRIKLASCKPGVTYAFNTGTVPATGAPFVSVWAGDQTQTKVPMIEKITLADPIQANGQPKYTKLLYTDTFPFVAANATAMPYCLLDPRVTDDMTLPDPLTAAVLPGTATSCLISLTTSVDTSGHGTMLAYVFSAIDGLRTSG